MLADRRKGSLYMPAKAILQDTSFTPANSQMKTCALVAFLLPAITFSNPTAGPILKPIFTPFISAWHWPCQQLHPVLHLFCFAKQKGKTNREVILKTFGRML